MCVNQDELYNMLKVEINIMSSTQ